MCTVPILIGASIAFTAMGTYQQYTANRSMGRHAQKAAQRNAAIAEMQAADALERGSSAENDMRRQIAAIRGEQRAGLAGSGFDVDFGSSVDIVEDTARLGEEDILNIRANAEREAWAYRNEAQTLLNQGQYLQQTYNTRADASLITGAGQVADIWARYKMSTG